MTRLLFERMLQAANRVPPDFLSPFNWRFIAARTESASAAARPVVRRNSVNMYP
ncbi:MAG: hypothetical protein ABI969_13540 [bacterium]